MVRAEGSESTPLECAAVDSKKPKHAQGESTRFHTQGVVLRVGGGGWKLGMPLSKGQE